MGQLDIIQVGEKEMEHRAEADICEDVTNFVFDSKPDNKYVVFDKFLGRGVRNITVILETLVGEQILPKDFMNRKRNETETES